MPVWKRIVCAIDFSAPSRAALVQAAELASRGAELTLVHVQEIPAVRRQLGMLPNPPLAYEAEVDEAWKQLKRAGTEAEAIAHSPVPLVMLEGSPVDEVVRVARDHRADLLVVGTHGRTGVRRAVLGSVAEQIVRRAGCSVLVVRPEALVEERPD